MLDAALSLTSVNGCNDMRCDCIHDDPLIPAHAVMVNALSIAAISRDENSDELPKEFPLVR